MQEQGWKITYVFEEIFLGYLGFCPMNTVHKTKKYPCLITSVGAGADPGL